MHLVEHHEPKTLKESCPARVMREDAGAQHVGVGHDHRAVVARPAARIARRVPVVDDARNADAGCGNQLAEARFLVARERLRRVETERARVAILRQRLQDGQVKTQALAAGRGRGDDEMPARRSKLERLCLVGEELRHASLDECTSEPLVQRSGQRCRATRRRREGAIGRQARLDVPRAKPPGDGGVETRCDLPRGGWHPDYTKQIFSIPASQKHLAAHLPRLARLARPNPSEKLRREDASLGIDVRAAEFWLGAARYRR
jgi:hypothetical protein